MKWKWADVFYDGYICTPKYTYTQICVCICGNLFIHTDVAQTGIHPEGTQGTSAFILSPCSPAVLSLEGDGCWGQL